MKSELINKTEPLPPKSTFVNVLAWIFIIFGGFTTFISIMQNIMIHTVFPKTEMAQFSQQTDQAEHIPAFVQFMFNHFDLIFMMFFVLSATSFISAIALLKRKNWARIVFISLMSLGIVWNVTALIMQFKFFSSIPEMSGGHAPPPEFQNMMQIMKVASIIFAGVLSALFGFVIKKLCSQRIRAEFA